MPTLVHATGVHVRALQCQVGLASVRAAGSTPDPVNITGDPEFDRTVHAALDHLRGVDQLPVLEVAYLIKEVLIPEFPEGAQRALLKHAMFRTTTYVRTMAALQIQERSAEALAEASGMMDRLLPLGQPRPIAELPSGEALGAKFRADIQRLVDELKGEGR